MTSGSHPAAAVEKPAWSVDRGLVSARAMTGRASAGLLGEFPDHENVLGADDPASLTFFLSYVPIEPVLERSRADARIRAGGERLIVDDQAVVERINICDHLARIFCRA